MKVSEISIIIPLYNAFDYTKSCLESIFESMKSTKEISFEIIIVDNNSYDLTESFFKTNQFKNLRYFRMDRNLGFAKACNFGASVSSSKNLYFLNNDTKLFPSSIPSLWKTLRSSSAIGIVGSRLLYQDLKIQHAGMAADIEYGFKHLFRYFPAEHPLVTKRRSLQAITGASLFVSKKNFETLSGFDESFLNSNEDVDICLRMKELGKEIIYEPESVLIHYESSSEGRTLSDEKANKQFLEKWKGKFAYDYYEKTVTYAEKLLTSLKAQNDNLSKGFPIYKEKLKVKEYFENINSILIIEDTLKKYQLEELLKQKENYIQELLNSKEYLVGRIFSYPLKKILSLLKK